MGVGIGAFAGVARRLKSWLDRLEEWPLQRQSAVWLFPLNEASAAEPDSAYRSRLRELAGVSSPFNGIPGLHSARYVVLRLPPAEADPTRSVVTPAAVSQGVLMFSVWFDGHETDLIQELLEQGDRCLEPALRGCGGFPGITDTQACVQYFQQHRLASKYGFVDSQTDRTSESLCASVEEVTRALRVRRSFLSFMIEQQCRPGEQDMPALRDAFEQWRTEQMGAVYPLPLHERFEELGENEEYWVRRAATMTRAAVRREYRASRRRDKTAPALRGQHAKHHGLLHGELYVRPDLEQRLEHGIFRPGARHRVLLRLSNSSTVPDDDRRKDARGLALKVLDVESYGDAVLPAGTDVTPHPARSSRTGLCQDFIFVTNPSFFIKDARDYTVFRSMVELPNPRLRMLNLAAFFARRPREGLIFGRTLLHNCQHPLDEVYHTMLPVALGPSLAMKLSLRPLPDHRPCVLSGPVDKDYLRDRLRRSLDPHAGREIQLELSIHLPRAGVDARFLCENPHRRWNADEQRIPVARLVIAPQELLPQSQAESEVFSPWHALADHRPLGALNRARLYVYQASADQRRQLNRAGPVQTTGARRSTSAEWAGSTE